ncbi:hypothetical protein [Puniceibacterium antarcticum]|uniref:hypothetical protein n=1 Tax=Puniceibacterium antarcticum TaxID=1206336 RepID=UPI001179B466|nr:hypothetical protein [Puniceibacterium antarcticum]
MLFNHMKINDKKTTAGVVDIRTVTDLIEIINNTTLIRTPGRSVPGPVGDHRGQNLPHTKLLVKGGNPVIPKTAAAADGLRSQTGKRDWNSPETDWPNDLVNATNLSMATIRSGLFSQIGTTK